MKFLKSLKPLLLVVVVAAVGSLGITQQALAKDKFIFANRAGIKVGEYTRSQLSHMIVTENSEILVPAPSSRAC